MLKKLIIILIQKILIPKTKTKIKMGNTEPGLNVKWTKDQCHHKWN